MKVSIRRRLLTLLLMIIGAVWGVVTWGMYVKTQHEVEELFDAQLAQSARVLFGLLKHEMVEEEDDQAEEHEEEKRDGKWGVADWQGINLEEFIYGHRYEHKLAFLVRTQDGKILVRSAAVPAFSLPNSESPHFGNQIVDGHWWRVFTRQEGLYVIQTGERGDIRNELIGEIMSSTLRVLFLTIPLLAVLIWVSISHSLQPLQRVATQIASRCPDQLQPLDTRTIPVEITAIINALNQLFARLARAFENERRFTADAAHELRNPLAGVKTQAQVAQRASDLQQRQQALQQVVIGVDRATHLVSQLLTLARMDAAQSMPTADIDLPDLVTEVLMELAPAALEKEMEVGFDNSANESLLVGNHDALSLLFRNLIDNAICYTPNGGQVMVSLSNLKPSQITFQVCDTGPGIPPEQRQRIFERFYRGENQNIPGSGLGLSIAKRVAELHGVKIELGEGTMGKGLCVKVDFRVQRKKTQKPLV
jgi:two-component system sensor histidine kinase QseC